MIKITTLLLIVFLTTAGTVFAQGADKQNVIDVNLHFKNNEITLGSVDKRLGYVPDYLNQPEEGYSLQIFDQNARTLFTVKFNFPLQRIVEKLPQQETGGSIQNQSETDKTITVPAFNNAQKLIVTDAKGEKLLEHELAPLVDPQLPNRPATKTTSPALIIGLVALLVISVFGFILFFLIKRRSSGS